MDEAVERPGMANSASVSQRYRFHLRWHENNLMRKYGLHSRPYCS